MPEPKMSTSTSTTSADTPGSLRLMSWNVAGWIRTAKLLVKYHGSIANYLSKHNVDILAVQESKVSKTRVASTEGHEAIPEGYEAYWSHSTSKPGFNGVCTFVRKGVLVRDVLTRPFNDSRYDDEGRCLVTFHGDDVALVNVYVPNGGEGGKRLPYKMQFLQKLRALCRDIRKRGWKVVLLGDLNMAPDPKDIWWEYRIIDVSRLLADLPKGGEIKDAVSSENWDRVMRVMKTREVVQISPDRYRVKVDIASECNRRVGTVREALSSATGDGVKTVYLGSASNSMLSLRSSYNLDLVVLEDGTVVKPSGWIEVDEFFEIIRKVIGIDISIAEQRKVADIWGMGDGMRDSFRWAHPNAKERFTCWDQYRNRRYINAGSRIDYILVDDTIEIEKGAQLPLGCDAEAALRCATAGGLHAPAPRFGEDKGIPEMDSEVACEWEFVNCSQPFRTGIVYTAPVFSDHVAVTALLQVDFQRPGKAQVDETQASERLHEAQSHKEGRRPPKGNQDIAVFFRSMATKKKAEEECSGLGRPAAKAKKARQAGIRRWLKQPVGSPTNDSSSSDDTAIGEPMKKKMRI
ncbi:hypothetical protein FOZ61_008135 [Perkinsus olseni]|uniref:DNA-(apurinic or apyrimidinic site) endonuclease n=1 Tax=Perkinsus olseni TaxID=32597 RepID=A0A7J6LEK1_PEROL|nr:hypothetical protein FOZ61_008135 [Perkinsus olseni]KAF4657678.1 hypothetical protein FOL46_007301 [Perkinsus olseni]